VELAPQLAAFLEEQRVGRLATVDAAGLPHVLPVCYALLREPQGGDAVYSVVDEKPKRGDPRRLARLRHLRAHPGAALVVDVWDERWSRLGWVMLRGAAAVLDEGVLEAAGALDERARALAELRRRYPQYRAMALEGRPLIRLRPERVLHWGGAESPLADG
jgi:PPOX class probable F420-dependent enzyme